MFWVGLASGLFSGFWLGVLYTVFDLWPWKKSKKSEDPPVAPK